MSDPDSAEQLCISVLFTAVVANVSADVFTEIASSESKAVNRAHDQGFRRTQKSLVDETDSPLLADVKEDIRTRKLVCARIASCFKAVI